MRKSIITVLAALTASITAPAAAETVSVTVSFADLDLNTPAGTAALDQRIVAAAEQVCARPGDRALSAALEFKKCKAATLADARKKLAARSRLQGVALAASSGN